MLFDSTSEIAIYEGFVGPFMGDYDDREGFSRPVSH